MKEAVVVAILVVVCLLAIALTYVTYGMALEAVFKLIGGSDMAAYVLGYSLAGGLTAASAFLFYVFVVNEDGVF